MLMYLFEPVFCTYLSLTYREGPVKLCFAWAAEAGGRSWSETELETGPGASRLTRAVEARVHAGADEGRVAQHAKGLEARIEQVVDVRHGGDVLRHAMARLGVEAHETRYIPQQVRFVSAKREGRLAEQGHGRLQAIRETDRERHSAAVGRNARNAAPRRTAISPPDAAGWARLVMRRSVP